jgi:hypothetical protein
MVKSCDAGSRWAFFEMVNSVLIADDNPQHADSPKGEAHPEHEPEIEHSSFQNRHDSLLSLSTPPIVATLRRATRTTLRSGQNTSGMPDSDPGDRLAAADVVLRQEPDEEEEDEGDGDGKENNDDDDKDDSGYSE